MKLKLTIDGKERIFAAGFISARMLRKTIELSKKINFQDISADELDIMVGFLTELYSKQFSIDDVYDGLKASELVPTLIQSIQEVVGEVNEATSGDEKNV